MWDWATQPFNSVLLTFVFVPLYLVSANFLPADVAAQNADDTLVCSGGADAATEYCGGLADLSEWYGWATFLAGILILVLAPVLGQRADVAGNKKRWVVGATAVLALIQFSLFFVSPIRCSSGSARWPWRSAPSRPRSPASTTTRCSSQVSTPAHRRPGQRPRLGPRLHRRHPGARRSSSCSTSSSGSDSTSPNGLAYRLIAVGCAVWTVVFAIPFVLNVPEAPARTDRAKVGFFAQLRRARPRHRGAVPRTTARPSGSCSRAPCTATGSPASSRSAACSPRSPSASAPPRSSSSASPSTWSPASRRSSPGDSTIGSALAR